MPDRQQRRVDPGPGRDICLPVPELVSFRTRNRRPAGRGFILRQANRSDGAHHDSSQAPTLRNLTSGLRSGDSGWNFRLACSWSLPAGSRDSEHVADPTADPEPPVNRSAGVEALAVQWIALLKADENVHAGGVYSREPAGSDRSHGIQDQIDFCPVTALLPIAQSKSVSQS